MGPNNYLLQPVNVVPSIRKFGGLLSIRVYLDLSHACLSYMCVIYTHPHACVTSTNKPKSRKHQYECGIRIQYDIDTSIH